MRTEIEFIAVMLAFVICKLADIDEAVAVDNLEDTERGAGGFGSTGE